MNMSDIRCQCNGTWICVCICETHSECIIHTLNMNTIRYVELFAFVHSTSTCVYTNRGCVGSIASGITLGTHVRVIKHEKKEKYTDTSRHISTHSRHILDTFSTHSRHILDTSSTHSRHMCRECVEMCRDVSVDLCFL